MDTGLQAVLAFGPTGIAAIVGIVFAVLRWRSEPTIARFAVPGFVLLVITAALPVVLALSSSQLQQAGWSADALNSLGGGAGLAMLFTGLIGWALVLSALFWRLPAAVQAPAEVDSAPTGRHALLDASGAQVVAQEGTSLRDATRGLTAAAPFGGGVFGQRTDTTPTPIPGYAPGQDDPTQALPRVSASAVTGASTTSTTSDPRDEPAPTAGADAVSAGTEPDLAAVAVGPAAASTPEPATPEEEGFDERALADDAFDPYGIRRDTRDDDEAATEARTAGSAPAAAAAVPAGSAAVTTAIPTSTAAEDLDERPLPAAQGLASRSTADHDGADDIDDVDDAADPRGTLPSTPDDEAVDEAGHEAGDRATAGDATDAVRTDEESAPDAPAGDGSPTAVTAQTPSPAADRPAASMTTAAHPATAEPASEVPDADVPAADVPAAEGPAVEGPAVEGTESDIPAAHDTESDRPEAEVPAVRPQVDPARPVPPGPGNGRPSRSLSPRPSPARAASPKAAPGSPTSTPAASPPDTPETSTRATPAPAATGTPTEDATSTPTAGAERTAPSENGAARPLPSRTAVPRSSPVPPRPPMTPSTGPNPWFTPIDPDGADRVDSSAQESRNHHSTPGGR